MQTKIEKISALSALAINNIEEVAENGVDFLSFREKLSYANISHPVKRLEWKGARLAIKSALDCISFPYPGFYKDDHGKSHSMDQYGHVSLTHTRGIAAAIFHRDLPVGIDMDYVREKIIYLGPKFLQPSEIEFLGNSPLLFTIAWSAKETIYKCQGRKGISLKNNILLNPFLLEDKMIFGKVHQTDFSDHFYQVKVEHEKEMVLTYTIW